MLLCVPATVAPTVTTLPLVPVIVQFVIVVVAPKLIVCATVFVLERVLKVLPVLMVKLDIPVAPPIFNVVAVVLSKSKELLVVVKEVPIDGLVIVLFVRV
jgi:hypothetical protein